MALWQYDFHVLPKTTFHPSLIRIDAEEGWFDDSSFWEDADISPQQFEQLGKILPRGDSWSADLIIYGDVVSHCFKIFVEDDRVVSASVRINYLKDYERIVRELIDFLVAKELILLSEDLSPVLLNFETIQTLISKSQKMQTYRTLAGITDSNFKPWETPIVFNVHRQFDGNEVVYSDLMEVGQGGPSVGTVSINGAVVPGYRFGGPPLYVDGLVIAPVQVMKFLGSGFKLATINISTREVAVFGNVRSLIFLDTASGDEVCFFEDVGRTKRECVRFR